MAVLSLGKRVVTGGAPVSISSLLNLYTVKLLKNTLFKIPTSFEVKVKNLRLANLQVPRESWCRLRWSFWKFCVDDDGGGGDGGDGGGGGGDSPSAE